MAIGSISLQGQVTRAQDFSSIKHNEDNKVVVDQGNFQSHFNKEVKQNLSRVHQSDDTENPNKKYDAKEKGNGQYAGDGGRHRKKQENEGTVQKQLSVQRSFDMKI